MTRMRAGLALLGVVMLAGCVAPVGPVTVTRFHLPETAALGHGPIAVVAAQGVDPASLEERSYESAVGLELARLGYAVAPAKSAPGAGAQVAEVRVTRTQAAQSRGSPVRIGFNGETGGYGSGVGLGLSIPIGRPAAPPVTTELAVRISDAPGGRVLWEGRADFTVAASSPLAGTQLGAPKLAAALFAGFPGGSGETISVP